jgi:hypothetical protein
MMHTTKRLLQCALALAVGAGALFLNDRVSPQGPHALVSSAEARIGRPLTPLSYAGVARRTTRRAVAIGAAGAVIVAPMVVAPVVVPGPVPVRRCVQVVDAYGRILTRCY